MFQMIKMLAKKFSPNLLYQPQLETQLPWTWRPKKRSPNYSSKPPSVKVTTQLPMPKILIMLNQVYKISFRMILTRMTMMVITKKMILLRVQKEEKNLYLLTYHQNQWISRNCISKKLRFCNFKISIKRLSRIQDCPILYLSGLHLSQ